MCVIYFALGQHPIYPFILAANRDEFYDRPSAAAEYWPDDPNIYAGRDLKSGGTWLGVTRSGRLAAVTNYRDPTANSGTRSRGDLVSEYLKSESSSDAYLSGVANVAAKYSGFNLLVGGMKENEFELFYFSSRGSGPVRLSPGVYGLSNHLLDTPWPKVTAGKSRLARLLANDQVSSEDLFDILADESVAEDKDLPSTGIPYEAEKALSAAFIKTPGYGTRCSTVVKFAVSGEWDFEERVFI
jgi:uncharacterized protein with NRDE domain